MKRIVTSEKVNILLVHFVFGMVGNNMLEDDCLLGCYAFSLVEIPEDSHLRTRRLQNLKTRKEMLYHHCLRTFSIKHQEESPRKQMGVGIECDTSVFSLC
jgi:hypothetical protein